MRWEQGPRSSNVEDRRGMSIGAPIVGGIGALIVAGIALLLGADPGEVLQQLGGAEQSQQTAPPGQRADDRDADFASAVMAQTEQVWGEVFAARGQRYEPPVLVLYDGATDTGCGLGMSATGPFYCPEDHKLYLDLSFFRDMDERLGAKGDFARAYVIAHEVGHHVQNLTGIMDQDGAQPARGAGGGSVRLELQADCYAGVWANRAQAKNHILEAGDVDEALAAAAAVGDDRLQQANRGYVTPDSFTHGSSAQRQKWFTRGFRSGQVSDCDTFGAPEL